MSGLHARDGDNRLRDFIASMTKLVDQLQNDEDRLVLESRPLLAELLSDDRWLPDAFARPSKETYCQYLLHCDSLERFSVVSFVWAPGQRTPVHDHTVWGLVGILRGAESSQRYSVEDNRLTTAGDPVTLTAGDIDSVSPRIGDIHSVANAQSREPSISIHVYGGNIGVITRRVFDCATGIWRPFTSRYSNAFLPNIWDYGAGPRA